MLRVTSHYKIAGRILIMPIAGSGYSEGNYSKYSGRYGAQSVYHEIAVARYQRLNRSSNFREIFLTLACRMTVSFVKSDPEAATITLELQSVSVRTFHPSRSMWVCVCGF